VIYQSPSIDLNVDIRPAREQCINYSSGVRYSAEGFNFEKVCKSPAPGHGRALCAEDPDVGSHHGRRNEKVMVIPNNSVVDVATPLTGTQGLIEVKLNGETALMFAEDILQRGKRVSSASA